MYPGITRNFTKTGHRDNSTCDLSRDIPRQIKVIQLKPAVLFSPLEKRTARISLFSQVKPQYPILHKISEGYPGIGHRSGYPGISLIKLGYACLK